MVTQAFSSSALHIWMQSVCLSLPCKLISILWAQTCFQLYNSTQYTCATNFRLFPIFVYVLHEVFLLNCKSSTKNICISFYCEYNFMLNAGPEACVIHLNFGISKLTSQKALHTYTKQHIVRSSNKHSATVMGKQYFTFWMLSAQRPHFHTSEKQEFWGFCLLLPT